MVIPVLKTIDIIGKPELVDDFVLGAAAYIGEKNSEGIEYFYFKLITPKRLMRMLLENKVINCRATLVVNEFNIENIKDEVNKILSDCIRATWNETAQAINRFLKWEYDNIKYTTIEEAQKILSDKIDG